MILYEVYDGHLVNTVLTHGILQIWSERENLRELGEEFILITALTTMMKCTSFNFKIKYVYTPIKLPYTYMD